MAAGRCRSPLSTRLPRSPGAFGEDGPSKETGLLDSFDQRTRRRQANPSFELDADTAAGVIQVRTVDLDGRTAGPFPIAFDPVAETARGDRRILEMTAGSWVSFREFNGLLLYYTQVVSLRCAVRDLRIGIDSAVPDHAIPLPPCDLKNPSSILGQAPAVSEAPAGDQDGIGRADLPRRQRLGDQEPSASEGARAPFSLRRHIDDLHPAVLVGKRIGRVLELLLAVPDTDQILRRQAEFFDKKALHRLGAALRQALIVGVAPFGVGMPANQECEVLQFRRAQCRAKRDQRRHRLRTDHGRIVVEGDFEIDARLGLGDLGRLGALLDGNGPRLLTAQTVDKAAIFRVRGGNSERPRQPASDRLRLQCVHDVVSRWLHLGARVSIGPDPADEADASQEFSDSWVMSISSATGAHFISTLIAARDIAVGVFAAALAGPWRRYSSLDRDRPRHRAGVILYGGTSNF